MLHMTGVKEVDEPVRHFERWLLALIVALIAAVIVGDAVYFLHPSHRAPTPDVVARQYVQANLAGRPYGRETALFRQQIAEGQCSQVNLVGTDTSTPRVHGTTGTSLLDAAVWFPVGGSSGMSEVWVMLYRGQVAGVMVVDVYNNQYRCGTTVG